MFVNPDRVAFTLFGRDIYWYGVLMAVGIILAVILAMREGKRKKLPQDAIIDLCLVIIPCGIVGARIYYVLFELENYISNPISILYIWEGGLAIYGAVIFGLLGAVIYAKKKKIRFLRLVDCIAPGLVLAQAIGRWGNFFNQEAFGNPVTNEALLWFPMSVRIDAIHYFNGELCSNPYHLATFFYESLWCLLIFIALWLLRKKFKHDGDCFLLYALLYSFERMFVEGMRGDSLYLIQPDAAGMGGVRVSQLLSAIAFVALLAFFIVRYIKEKKLGKLIWPSPLAVCEAEEASEVAEDASKEQDNEASIQNEDETADDSANDAEEAPAEDLPVHAEDKEDDEEFAEFTELHDFSETDDIINDAANNATNDDEAKGE